MSYKTKLIILGALLSILPTLILQEPAAKVGMTNDLKFNPESITIKAGEMVLWENSSSLVHTVTFEPAKAVDPKHVQLPTDVKPFGSGRLSPGDTFKHTFEVPGTYQYFCIPHEGSGMIGQVIVQ